MVRHVITAVLKKTLDPSESPDSLLQDSKGKKIMSFIGTLKMEDPKSKQIPSIQSTKVSGHFETISGGGNKTSSIVIHGKIEEIPGVDWCLRCGDQVYPLEKLEPCPGQFYHERCFRCYECGTKLSLATFCKNLQITQDPRVYCRTHQPKLDKVEKTRTKEVSKFKNVTIDQI